MKIWVYAESEGDKATTATLELLTKAREVADTVEAVYIGPDAAAIAPQLGEYGAAKVFMADQGDSLAGVFGAAAIASIVEAESPDAILFAQSYDGRDAIAHLSAKLDRTVLTNGTSLAVDGDTMTVGTAIFGGNTLVDTAFDGPKPYLAAIRPKSFAAEAGGAAAGEVVAIAGVDAGRAGEAKLLERHVEEREGP
jgi:electron transfer flavoprotein alpha subunit